MPHIRARIIAICAVHTLFVALAPSPAAACDSVAPADVFSMSERAARVIVVTASAVHEADVDRDLKGSGARHIVVENSNCDPMFEPGARYLVFIDDQGRSVSGESAVLLVGRAGRHLVARVAQWIAATPPARRILARSWIAEESTGPAPAPDSYRYLRDLCSVVGGWPADELLRRVHVLSEQMLAQQAAMLPSGP